MESYISKINEIFNLKGLISPIAEKALKTLKLKENNKFYNSHLYYYIIGHKLKGIDNIALFKGIRNAESLKIEPTRYINLHNDYFQNDVVKIVNEIRNLYAHYIHDFEKMNIQNNTYLLNFLVESFEISVLLTYLKFNNKELNDVFKKESNYEKDKNIDKYLVKFLQSMFFPTYKNNKHIDKEKQKIENDKNKLAEEFLNLDLRSAIESILFIDVPEDFNWKIKNHSVFKISEGKYLSHTAHLFILSMFLYRNESEILISRIKGFKKNDITEFKNKRDIITFFSKKFGSQDINNEESNLIKFRDILQYLNKYPIAWKSEIEKEKSVIENKIYELKEKVYDFEILNAYPKLKDGRNAERDDKRFLLFAKDFFEIKKIKNKDRDFSEIEQDSFSYELFKNKIIQDAEWKISEYEKEIEKNKKDESKVKKLKKAIKDYQEEIQRIIQNEEEFKNKKSEKLKSRITKDALISSVCRNNDKFMEYAIRYLAETNYFGENAKFKSYASYGTKEQNDALEKEKLKLDNNKNAIGKLKFHKGKFVKFQSYKELVDIFPENYCPFVIENNAIQLLFDGYYISIQRNILPYFLEHSLYYNPKNITGENLLKAYINHQINGFIEATKIFDAASVLSEEEKRNLLKFIPKSIVHQKSTIERQEANMPSNNPFLDIIAKTEKAEKRFLELERLAKINNNIEQFASKNKGKQFKLYFIKRTWNIMFFKDKYKEKRAVKNEHHTNFHISREEFKDFSKYLFGLGDVQEYKGRLLLQLNSKSFLDEEGILVDIITNSIDIHEVYQKTKILFKEWIEENSLNKASEKPTINTLEKFVTERKQLKKQDGKRQHILYINASHFIDFMVSKNAINATFSDNKAERKIIYSALNLHKSKLINEYYPEFSFAEQKKLKAVFHKINTARLEDSYLFAIADYYLKSNLFNENIEQVIKNKNNKISIVFENTYKGSLEFPQYNVRDLLSLDYKFKVFEQSENSDKLKDYFVIIPFSKIDLMTSWLFNNKNEKDGDRSSIFLKDLPLYLEKRYCDFDYNEITLGKKNEKNRKHNKDIWDIVFDFHDNRTISWENITKVQNHILPLALQFTSVYMQLEKYYIEKSISNISIKNNRLDITEIPILREMFNFQTDLKNNSKKEIIIDNIRHEAFHLNFPRNKTYLQKLKELEKEIIINELNYLPKSWKEIKDEHCYILIFFQNTIYKEFSKYKTSLTIEDKNKNYFDAVIRPILFKNKVKKHV